MKKILGVIIMAASVFNSNAADDWKLVWSDEFDKDGLPDKTKWTYEVGFVRNEEKQYYTESRPENARVENGMLVIEGRREKFQNPKFKAGSGKWQENREFAEYTAASITTQNKFDVKYGRIELRAKLPQGTGIWPAIWMLGTNISKIGWPRCGEIDIMEFVGFEPNHVYATLHYSRDRKNAGKGNKIVTEKPSDDFHIYAVEWNSEKMDFYFDDKIYHTFKLDDATEEGYNPFRDPQYLLINLAIGGSWGGKVDDSIFPQKYLIDYVRVYQGMDPHHTRTRGTLDRAQQDRRTPHKLQIPQGSAQGVLQIRRADNLNGEKT
jgi:beta-glucanase (GH16 family)